MAEPTNSAVTDDNALPRCCPVHHDWPTLSQHLLVDFPEIGINDIIREIRNAKSAVESMALDDSDEIEIGEVLVRQQLMLRAGRRSDGARLDPEAHRGASAVCRVGATVGVSPTVDG